MLFYKKLIQLYKVNLLGEFRKFIILFDNLIEKISKNKFINLIIIILKIL